MKKETYMYRADALLELGMEFHYEPTTTGVNILGITLFDVELTPHQKEELLRRIPEYALTKALLEHKIQMEAKNDKCNAGGFLEHFSHSVA